MGPMFVKNYLFMGPMFVKNYLFMGPMFVKKGYLQLTYKVKLITECL